MSKPYRNGKVHVVREMCSTCIFRPGNLMHLEDGRRNDMVRQAKQKETAIICHSTLDSDWAVCAGFIRNHKTTTLRLAECLGIIELVEPSELFKETH